MVLRCAEVLPQFHTYFLLMIVYCSKELIWRTLKRILEGQFFPNLLSSSAETLTVARKPILRSY